MAVPLTACAVDELQFDSAFTPPDAGDDAESMPDAEAPKPPFCSIAPAGAICTHDDPTFVAHCVDGECVPFGCDYCPTPRCKDVFCFNGQCRQQDQPDRTPCVRNTGLPGQFGYLGMCEAGLCDGLTECHATKPCPEITCTTVECNDWLCKATYVAAGTECEKDDGSPGFCSNQACITLGGLK